MDLCWLVDPARSKATSVLGAVPTPDTAAMFFFPLVWKDEGQTLSSQHRWQRGRQGWLWSIIETQSLYPAKTNHHIKNDNKPMKPRCALLTHKGQKW